MKYYLRGLGTGLAVAVILLGISGVNAKTLGNQEKDPGEVAKASVSEEVKGVKESSEVIESSETVETSEAIESSETVETSEAIESSETVETSEAIESSETVETSEAIESSETVETSEAIESSESVESSEVIESSESAPTSETKEVQGSIQPSEAAEGDFTLTVQRGYSSWTVAKILAEAGIVEDAKTYDAYLCSHGYDKRISVGTFVIPEGSSDEEIAKIITGTK
ncbi:MAG: hypothetical protein IK081_06190 [Lachnospiraceae bacterium]|nr:hypothetical protein [Lachnospiraceae bacterium]